MKVKLLVLLSVLLALPSLFAQKNAMNNTYEAQWKEANELVKQGLPRSANEVAKKIYIAARNQNNHAQVIKSLLFLMDTEEELAEDSEVAQLLQLDTLIATSLAQEKALLQSITAQKYQSYYERNRWQLLQRTTLEGAPSEDITTWDATAFFKKIAQLYLSSLEDTALLKNTTLSDYEALLSKGVNTRHLRPTLYDLLAFRAIDYFKNEEKEIIQPAFKFQILSPHWFNPATNFITTTEQVADSMSLHFRALKLYQEVLQFHLHDEQPDALVDADLNRLEFVYTHSVHPDKYRLYQEALDQLAKQYPKHPAGARARLSKIALLLQAEDDNATDVEKNRSSTPELHTQLSQIAEEFPHTEAGIGAKNLMHSLEQKELDLQAEEVYVPDENIKVLVRYKNVPQVYLNVYRVAQDMDLFQYNDINKQWLPRLRQLKPLKSVLHQLPGAGDMKAHSTELKIDALPKGAYLVVAALKENIDAQEQLLSVIPIQISHISLVTSSSDTGSIAYTLHRKTGQPLAQAKLTFYRQQWDSKNQKYLYESTGVTHSGATGEATIPSPKSEGRYAYTHNRVSVIHDSDTLHIQENIVGNRYTSSGHADEMRTFFFTDRSLYRPGQTIYFKGIMLKSKQNGRENQVMGSTKTTVTFYDANQQKIDTKELTTNEFGSVSGSFVAPETGLTGYMSIGNEHGSSGFSVEEYKRPKFFVSFDSLKESYALNTEVIIKGSAKAYAGNTIGGASVKYRVVRQARFPYYWCYYRWGMPRSPEMEIANGNTITDEAGKFTIPFTTLPDAAIAEQALPVFSYTIYADITDLNGETRSGEINVQSGYRSLQIVSDIAEESRPEDLDTINVLTQNLNGVFVPATLELRIAALQFPGLFRKRLWEKPDQYSLDEATFRSYFPLDEYKEESNAMNWTEAETVYAHSLTSTASGQVVLPAPTWYKNGWYLIELKTKDAQGNEIVEKKYTHVWGAGKKEPVQKDFLTYTKQDTYQPGDTLELWLATGIENPYLLRQSGQISDGGNPIRIKLRPDHQGGLNFSWLYVANNRVYTASKYIDIPWTDKELKLEWATHRDKLLPGVKEQWTLTIKGSQSEKIAAEMIAGMYDASLDAFQIHRWSWDKLFPVSYKTDRWSQPGFGTAYGRPFQNIKGPTYETYEKKYDAISGLEGRYGISRRSAGGRVYMTSMNMNPVNEESNADAVQQSTVKFTPPAMKKNEEVSTTGTPQAPLQIRRNLQETAFFFPQLHTDADGHIRINFTLPEALTAWKLMAFAHTKDWRTGYLEGQVRTQKELMVVPNLPRFLRQGDTMQISTKISNLSSQALQGEATLEILDAATGQALHIPFRLQTKKMPFNVAKDQSTSVSWSVQVPESRYEPVNIRVIATAGNFSDGEENTLPVVTNRMLVTETLPLPVRGNATKSFAFDKLLQQQSTSLSHHALTMEYTGNPAWYAVQALPYLMEFPYECAEQTFNRYFANALAAHIVSLSPQVKQIFDQWAHTDTAALLSNLEKNPELKSALLEETPWVMEARTETEQKHRIARLFETHKLAKEGRSNLETLAQMQLPEGGFPWFKGMRSDRYITQYIVTGLGRLQQLGISPAEQNKTDQIIKKALTYLDRTLKADYDQLIKENVKLDQQHINHLHIQYLYLRSFFANRPVPAASQKAFAYYKEQAAKYWTGFNPYMQGQIALALHRNKDATTPSAIIASLKERAIIHEEMGMYWKRTNPGYWWYEAPIEAQALLIEAFTEVAKDTERVDALKIWLLKQKQTQNWKTTKATADACYALLLQGGKWLDNQPEVTIKLGAVTINPGSEQSEAGTGYFKHRIAGREVTPEMGNIQVQISGNKEAQAVSWGAAYWQYFEDMDKITPAATPLQLSKQLFIERHTDRGPVLTELKDGNELNVGDKVKVRIILKADRDMEYVHLKDMRAACFEPVNVLSGYRYQGGLSYYESTKDVSSNFFIDYLRKGSYVFEYTVFVQQRGYFSNGISTIQCMYAPEFSSHSEGTRVYVK